MYILRGNFAPLLRVIFHMSFMRSTKWQRASDFALFMCIIMPSMSVFVVETHAYRTAHTSLSVDECNGDTLKCRLILGRVPRTIRFSVWCVCVCCKRKREREFIIHRHMAIALNNYSNTFGMSNGILFILLVGCRLLETINSRTCKLHVHRT